MYFFISDQSELTPGPRHPAAGWVLTCGGRRPQPGAKSFKAGSDIYSSREYRTQTNKQTKQNNIKSKGTVLVYEPCTVEGDSKSTSISNLVPMSFLGWGQESRDSRSTLTSVPDLCLLGSPTVLLVVGTWLSLSWRHLKDGSVINMFKWGGEGGWRRLHHFLSRH